MDIPFFHQMQVYNKFDILCPQRRRFIFFFKKLFLDPLYLIYSPGNSKMAQESNVKEPWSVNLRTSILHMMQAFSAVIRQFRCVMTDLSLHSGWTQLIPDYKATLSPAKLGC